MKTLYIIRHAKSDWNSGVSDDFVRSLNSRGKRDAPLMGEVLNSLSVKPDLILASSAKRARKTALILAEKLAYPAENILFYDDMYLASDSEIATFVHAVDDSISSLFIVAHNPGLTNFINRFTDDFLENLPTTGVFAITFDISSWKDMKPRSGKKLFFEYPKKHL